MPSMRSCYLCLPRVLLLALAVGGMGYISSSWDTRAHKVCRGVCADAKGYFAYPVGGQHRVADCNNIATPSFVYPSNGDETVGSPECPPEAIFPVKASWGVLVYLFNDNQLKAASPELHGKLQAREAELRFQMTIDDCQCGVPDREWSFWTKKVFIVCSVCLLLLLLGLYLLFWAVKWLSLWVIRHTLLASAGDLRVQDACKGGVTIDDVFLQPMLGKATDIEFSWAQNTSETPKLDQLICQPIHADLRYFFCHTQRKRIARTARGERDKVKAAITELGLIADRWVMVQTMHFGSLVIFTCGIYAFIVYKLV